MKYIPRMSLMMRNYVKILMLIIIIFQAIVVIVTLERPGDEGYVPKYNIVEKSNETTDSYEKNNTFQQLTSPIKPSESIWDKVRKLFHFNNFNNSSDIINTNNSLKSPDHLPQNVQTKHDKTILSDTTVWPIKDKTSTESESIPINIVSYLLKTLNVIVNPKDQSAVTTRDSEEKSEGITFNPINNGIQSEFSTLKKIWETTTDTIEEEKHFVIQEILSNLDKYHDRFTTEDDIYSSQQPMYMDETTMKPKLSTLTPIENNFAIDISRDFQTTNVPLTTENKKLIQETKQHNSLKDILSWFHKKREDQITSSSIEPIETTSEYDGLFRSSSEYDTVAMIRGAGYPVETYRVQTADGYILTVYRIPPTVPAGRPARRHRLPVYLQHGLWSSSYHWFETKPQYSLPCILSDAGYDVWIGNSRGNVISREHVYLSTATNSSFWDFSFHEMGIYDLPATIELVLNVSKKPQIHYIGHSMGTTMFFVMASMRPDVASKVHFMLALAPIATVGPIHNFFRWMLLFERFILTREKPVAFLTQNGISLKTVLHYMQLYVTGKFAMYDYGKIANMDIYKSEVPPAYDLTRIELPIVLCYGINDPFVRTEDLVTLTSSLGNSLGMWPVPLTHFQLTGGRATQEYLYKYIPLHLH